MEVRLNTVSNESSHGNTSVLDLSMTKETNSGVVALTPPLSLGEVEGIVESETGLDLSARAVRSATALEAAAGVPSSAMLNEVVT